MDASLIANILGSGITVAVINWFYQHRSGRTNRRSAWLERQLQQLYGPLCYLISANEELLRHVRLLEGAFEVEYTGKTFSDIAHESISKEVKDTINVQNRYTQLMIDNNSEAVRLIRDHYAFIDLEDATLMQELVMDSVRWEQEARIREPDTRLPLRIALTVPPVRFHRAETVERIKTKFAQKQAEILRLTGVARK